MSPDVTVVVATRDRAHLLPRALRSILSQTHPGFEIIVVDDGSTDGTAEVVSALQDPRIRYLRNDVSLGAGGAVNRGIAEGRAPFVAFLDDDDEWLPTKLEVQLQRFREESPDTGVVYTGRWLLRGGTRTYGPPPSILARGGRIHREILLRQTFIPLICAMVRRACFDELGGFDEALPTSCDYDLWVRLSRSYRFVYVPEPLAVVHFTPGSVSSRPDFIIAARKRLLAKHAAEMKGEGRAVAAFFLWQAGSLLAVQGNMTEARRYLARAALRYPRNPGYALAFAGSLLGQRAYVRGVFRPVHLLRHWARGLVQAPE